MVSPDTNSLACTYAALILHDSGSDMSAENIGKIIKAAKLDVDPFWSTMFAKALKGCKIDDLLDSVANVAPAPAGGGAAAAAPAAAAVKAPAAAAAKAPEPEEDEDMGFSLFD